MVKWNSIGWLTADGQIDKHTENGELYHIMLKQAWQNIDIDYSTIPGIETANT